LLSVCLSVCLHIRSCLSICLFMPPRNSCYEDYEILLSVCPTALLLGNGPLLVTLIIYHLSLRYVSLSKESRRLVLPRTSCNTVLPLVSTIQAVSFCVFRRNNYALFRMRATCPDHLTILDSWAKSTNSEAPHYAILSSLVTCSFLDQTILHSSNCINALKTSNGLQ
jgi:hypothetical protein